MKTKDVIIYQKIKWGENYPSSTLFLDDMCLFTFGKYSHKVNFLNWKQNATIECNSEKL